MKIIITQRTGDIKAHLESNPGIWGCGKGPNEAIGNLISAHPATFNVQIEFAQTQVLSTIHLTCVMFKCKLTGKNWKRNGSTKTWKTRPGEFRIPVKHGLYSYGVIDHNNWQQFEPN